MNEKDCVRLYWDGFRFGLIILLILIVFLITFPGALDWPTAAEQEAGGQLPERGFLKSVAFLCSSVFFWLGWAVVLQRLRREAVAIAAQGSTGGGDFLARVGLGNMNWALALFSIVVSWYAVFDDRLKAMPSLVVVAIIAAIFLLTYSKCRR